MSVRNLTDNAAINGTNSRTQNSSHCYQVCCRETKGGQSSSVFSVLHPLVPYGGVVGAGKMQVKCLPVFRVLNGMRTPKGKAQHGKARSSALWKVFILF